VLNYVSHESDLELHMSRLIGRSKQEFSEAEIY